MIFNTTEVNFGCILNDTEVLRNGSITNNSPLPVRYSWYFIKRPPVVRQEPELDDEGVDMESEYDSDEIEPVREEEGERRGGGGGGGVSGSERKPTASTGSGGMATSGESGSREKDSSGADRGEESMAVSPFIVIEDASKKAESVSGTTQSIHVTIDSQPAVMGEEEAEEGEGEGQGSGSASGSDPVNSLSSSASLHDDSDVVVLESGLPPISPPPAVLTTPHSVVTAPPPQEEVEEERTRRKKKKKMKPVWERAFDPFKPIPISQV